MTWSKCERFNLKGLVSWSWSFEIFPNRSMQFCIYFPLFFLLFSFSGHVFTWIPQSNDFRTSLEEICYAALHDVPDHFLEPNRSFLLGLGHGAKQHEGHRNDFPTTTQKVFSKLVCWEILHSLHTQCHSYLISAWISTNSKLSANQWLEGAKSVAKKKQKNENVQSLNFHFKNFWIKTDD